MENSKQKALQFDFPEMKPFKTVLKNFATMGISPKLVTQSIPLNGKILMRLSALTAGVSFIGVYVIKEANTFVEYTQSTFLAAAGSLVILLLLILILKVEKLFEFINRCDSMLNTSK